MSSLKLMRMSVKGGKRRYYVVFYLRFLRCIKTLLSAMFGGNEGRKKVIKSSYFTQQKGY